MCGLDPSAGRGFNGYAILEGSCTQWRLVASHASRSLYRALEALRDCDIIGVDAPLTLPYRGFREAERVAARLYGARFLPGGTPGMRALALRGFSVRQLLEEAGIAVVETHPGSIARVSRLAEGRDDRLDAVLAAGAAAAHYCGVASYAIGVDGVIVLARVVVEDGLVRVLPLGEAPLGPG